MPQLENMDEERSPSRSLELPWWRIIIRLFQGITLFWIIWAATGILPPALSGTLESLFFLEWLFSVLALSCAVLIDFVVYGVPSTIRTRYLFCWIFCLVCITVGWFPFPFESPLHRAIWYRSVLRIPAFLLMAAGLTVISILSARLRPTTWTTRLSEILLVFTATATPTGLVETYYRWNLPTVAGAGDPYDLCTMQWIRLYDPNSVPVADNLLSSNRFRLRDEPEPEPKSPKHRRVLFVGDSITYGWGVNRVEDTMSRVTESLLQASLGPHIQTGSIARFNVDTRQERQLLNGRGLGWRPLTWQPDVIVLIYDLSDITGESGPAPSRLTPPSSLMRRFMEHSFFVSRFYWTRVFQSGLNENHLDWLIEQYKNPDIWKRQSDQIGLLVNDCLSRDIPLIIVLAPFLSAIEHYPEELRDIHVQLADFLETQGVQALDAIDLFAGSKSLDWMVNHADRHPNAAAHRKYAEFLVPALIPILKKPVKRASDSE